jgi:hypothetical protein
MVTYNDGINVNQVPKRSVECCSVGMMPREQESKKD